MTDSMLNTVSVATDKFKRNGEVAYQSALFLLFLIILLEEAHKENEIFVDVYRSQVSYMHLMDTLWYA